MQWFTQDKFERLSVNTIRKDSPEGCILEVVLKDWIYAEEQHDLDNEYPLAPAKIELKEGMLSNYCKNKISVGAVKKHTHSLSNKDKYVLPFTMLFINLKKYFSKLLLPCFLFSLNRLNINMRWICVSFIPN